MAIAAVTATRLLSGSGNNVSGSISATAGNALVVAGVAYHQSDTTVSFFAARTGDTYTTDIDADRGSAPNINLMGIASAPNVAGGSVSMTVTSTGSVAGVEAYAFEVSGLATSSIRDATSPAIKTGSSTTASTNGLTNATADAIFVSLIATSGGGNPGTCTNTGTGFSDVAGAVTMQDLNGAADAIMDVSYKIVSATGAQNGAATTDNVAWGGLIAVYKMAAGAVSTLPLLPPSTQVRFVR